MPQATGQDRDNCRLHAFRLTHERLDVHIRSSVGQFDGEPVLGQPVCHRHQSVDSPAPPEAPESAYRRLLHPWPGVRQHVREPWK